MKYLLLLLPLYFSCTKADLVPSYQSAKGGQKGKPKDTLVVVTPPDTITDPIVVQPSFPSVFTLWTPTPRSQGGEGSCIPFSGCYARSIYNFYQKGDTAMFSPEFTYNQTKFGDCGQGTSITTVLDLFKSKGVCKWATMPYSAGDCSLQPNVAQLSEALNYKITSYQWVFLSDLSGLKNLLMAHRGIIIAVTPDNAFLNASFGFVWKEFTSDKTAGHSLVIVGWDDSKNAFKVINSQGEGWGEWGYSWIDYGFLPYTGNGTGYYIN